MVKISLFSSFVFVMRVVVIFVEFVGNLSYNYASYVDLTLCARGHLFVTWLISS